MKILPSKEEIDLALHSSSSVKNLSICESFVSLSAETPWLESYLKVLKFIYEFKDYSESISSSLSAISNASKEVLNSTALRKIMIAILELGNLLNRGSKKVCVHLCKYMYELMNDITNTYYCHKYK